MSTQTRVLDVCASPLPEFSGRQDHEPVPALETAMPAGVARARSGDRGVRADEHRFETDCILCPAPQDLRAARHRRKDTRRQLGGWTKGVISDTLKAMSLHKGSARRLSIQPAHRKSPRGRACFRARAGVIGFCCVDGVVGGACQRRLQHPGPVGRP